MQTPALTSAADLIKTSNSYWVSCVIHAGVAHELFTALADKPLTSTEVANSRQLDQRAAAMLLDALSALHLLEKQNDHYSLQPQAARFLSKRSPEYIGHILMHHHHLMTYWSRLPEAVKKGESLKDSIIGTDDASVRESFLMGMFNLGSMLAPRVAEAVDLTGKKRLLDLGGGPGAYAIAFCQKNPELCAMVYDHPATRPFSEKQIANARLDKRIDFQDGNFHQDPLPGTFDVAWLSHILHSNSPQQSANILAKAVTSLEPGGLLLIQEFILDDQKNSPLFPTLFSLNMLLVTPKGQAYSESDLKALMLDAGLDNIVRLPVNLPNGTGIMAGYLANNP